MVKIYSRQREKQSEEEQPLRVYTEEIEELQKTSLTSSLEGNLATIQKILEDCPDIVYREFYLEEEQVKAYLIFSDGLVDKDVINNEILKFLMLQAKNPPLNKTLVESIKKRILPFAETKLTSEVEKIIDGILSGNSVILVDGYGQALVCSTQGWEHRAIAESQTESLIRGPREAFIENLTTNLALLRRKIKSPNLKFEKLRVGRITKTDVVVAYIKGIADDKIVEEVKTRINRIDIDGVLESNYLEEFIDDNPYSPFPTIKHTERPDTTAGLLLEGRVAVFTDGTPFVLTMPHLFTSNMQSSEDYYEKYFISSAIRLIRYIALNISLLLPSLYIAISTFHQEMLPTLLLLSLAGQREGVPFPAVVEVLIMEITFEILREAGIRLPRPVGQAVSIVGALVIGEAAVNAGIVSPAMVIVVALTGISNFVIPAYNTAATIRLMRFPLIFLSATLGLFGVMWGLMALQVHLASLRSFGVPYLSPMAPASYRDLKDVMVRAPWWAMFTRPRMIGYIKPERQSTRLRPKPPQERS